MTARQLFSELAQLTEIIIISQICRFEEFLILITWASYIIILIVNKIIFKFICS